MPAEPNATTTHEPARCDYCRAKLSGPVQPGGDFCNTYCRDAFNDEWLACNVSPANDDDFEND